MLTIIKTVIKDLEVLIVQHSERPKESGEGWFAVMFRIGVKACSTGVWKQLRMDHRPI